MSSGNTADVSSESLRARRGLLASSLVGAALWGMAAIATLLMPLLTHVGSAVPTILIGLSLGALSISGLLVAASAFGARVGDSSWVARAVSLGHAALVTRTLGLLGVSLGFLWLYGLLGQ